jgi:hypothetical protein
LEAVGDTVGATVGSDDVGDTDGVIVGVDDVGVTVGVTVGEYVVHSMRIM